MTDFFSLLDFPRQPWLDPEEVKQRFLSLSQTCHPDRFHDRPLEEKAAAHRRYLDLNTASQCLSQPRERMLHLLGLETGQKLRDLQELKESAGLDFVFEAGMLCRQVDAFLEQTSSVDSPLLKVKRFQAAQAWEEKIGGLQKRISADREAQWQQTRLLNEGWKANPEQLATLEQHCRRLGYLNRWHEQLQERSIRLALLSL